MNKKALITGFTGQVGSQMADFLLKETNFDIIGMMRWQEPMNNIYHLNQRINSGDRISVHYLDYLLKKNLILFFISVLSLTLKLLLIYL